MHAIEKSSFQIMFVKTICIYGEWVKHNIWKTGSTIKSKFLDSSHAVIFLNYLFYFYQTVL